MESHDALARTIVDRGPTRSAYVALGPCEREEPDISQAAQRDALTDAARHAAQTAAPEVVATHWAGAHNGGLRNGV